MAGWLDTLNSMDEDLCKRVVNAFAKRAFGKEAEVKIEESWYKCNEYEALLHFKDALFYLIPFKSDKEYCSNGFHELDKPSWRSLLIKMLELADDGGYVSYLPQEKHIVDSSTTLEEALMLVDLNSFN